MNGGFVIDIQAVKDLRIDISELHEIGLTERGLLNEFLEMNEARKIFQKLIRIFPPILLLSVLLIYFNNNPGLIELIVSIGFVVGLLGTLAIFTAFMAQLSLHKSAAVSLAEPLFTAIEKYNHTVSTLFHVLSVREKISSNSDPRFEVLIEDKIAVLRKRRANLIKMVSVFLSLSQLPKGSVEDFADFFIDEDPSIGSDLKEGIEESFRSLSSGMADIDALLDQTESDLTNVESLEDAKKRLRRVSRDK